MTTNTKEARDGTEGDRVDDVVRGGQGCHGESSEAD